ncbi:DUF1778 domain-containing protein [Pseudidiomarina aestuarii]|uniref:type II toxin-antitoxin system TacA family antitoxin n=1 Tax=Pseudidiomarina aestuarii TaxID=624146 RepID=UPI003A9843CF
MMNNNLERDRITARIPKHIKDDIQAAADMVGSQLNDFIVQAALQKAQEIIARDKLIELTVEDSKVFYNAIDNPDEPNAKLKAAAARARSQGLA